MDDQGNRFFVLLKPV